MTRCAAAAAAAVVMLLLALVVGVPLMMVSAMVSGNADSSTLAGAASVSSCTINSTSAAVGDLDAEQVKNARTIIAVGKSMHIPARGWVIAIATALQESGLRSLDYGDRDSLGLMQQRPSTGWGTAAQVEDPVYAARAFYGGPSSPTHNSGLLSVPGWQQMPLWEAAQSVQRSGFPFAYAQHEALATDLVQRLAGRTAGCSSLRPGRWGLPVAISYTLTSGFGPRISPTRGTSEVHTGQDFAVPIGTPALAVSSGVVDFTGWDGGYGNLVRVRHADGVESWYGHLSRIEVKAGQHVDQGQELARTGSTGNSTGPHLHLEIRVDDQPTDPLPWLRSKGLAP